MSARRPGASNDSTASEAQQLLKVEDVAARLQVSTKSVRRWIAAGELIVHRLGSSIRISETDLARFLKARREP